jgi:hypothetical protein
MSKLSQSQKVVEFLKAHPDQHFTAREIAQAIVAQYPEDYQAKRQRSSQKFATTKDFVTQVVAEIGAQKQQICKQSNQIQWQDKPRPRKYWYASGDNESLSPPTAPVPQSPQTEPSAKAKPSYCEQDLYPLLEQYLSAELNLYCLRINEKLSSNTKGSGGNTWLHPDLVALEPMADKWHPHVKTCVHKGDGQSVRLWSFEVKKRLSMGDVRKSFFQTVSNSSWANLGYLVTAEIADNRVEEELRMLSALHGIGVILLDPDNPYESDLLLPAKVRAQVDWQSVDRIVKENKDFHEYITQVGDYYQTGRLRGKDWNLSQD